MSVLMLERLTEPVTEPVSLDEAKAQVRVDGPDHDLDLAGTILAAVEYVEDSTNRALIEQSWRWTMSRYTGRCWKVPIAPLKSVTSITLTDNNGNQTVLAPADYTVTTSTRQASLITLSDGVTIPTLADANGIVVEFVAGYGTDPEDVPKLLRQAILLIVAHWFENREAAVVTPGATAVEAPLAVDSIMQKLKVR